MKPIEHAIQLLAMIEMGITLNKKEVSDCLRELRIDIGIIPKTPWYSGKTLNLLSIEV